MFWRGFLDECTQIWSRADATKLVGAASVEAAFSVICEEVNAPTSHSTRVKRQQIGLAKQRVITHSKHMIEYQYEKMRKDPSVSCYGSVR